ncbi:probable disease resistance protein At5g66900 [Cucurbita moschata]|uniref:Probable disease resistance protein At5g66900 n=1 Tax=Cucurbita moschata TaxID=3662 RepID=A0A6J1G462_CUCMO|nr:probable disease resistance protein At5g66900 [Cucurbita moschata]
MAGALIGGAGLGVPFNELAAILKKFGERAMNFDPVLKEIQSKVNTIIPLVAEIEELNEALEYPKEELENLKKTLEVAKKLIPRCVGLWKYNYLRKSDYTKKLRELNSEIGSFRDILLIQTARDGKKTMKLASEIKDVVHRIDSKCEIINTVDLSVAVPEIEGECVGLEKPVERLKTKLFKDGVRLLVVTAYGGCGKTTLAVRFCHDKQVKNKFQKNILFLTVSSKPDTKLILKSIIQSLGRFVVSDSVNDDEAFRHLEQLMGQSSRNPVLFVLDDVWEGPESNKLLEKFSRMPNCKILVTSRNKFPAFGEPYALEPLSDEDAKELFRRAASLDNRTRQFPDEQIVEAIVKGCKKCPLALKVIARSLSGRTAPIWKATERNISRGDFILGSEETLLECLKSSLDAVSDDKMILKECFMDLGSFPEDQRIRVATFIDICAVLYEQDECETLSNLDELFTRNLVNTVYLRNEAHEDDYYSESYITQHDILRQLAVHLTNEQRIDQRTRLFVDISRNEFPEWWSKKEMQPVKARLLSITTDEMFSSCWPDMEAPEVEVLILNPGSKTYELPEFVKRMNRLKALIVRNYRSFPTELTSGYQVMNCLSRLERISLERISIPSFSNHNLKPLLHLKKLSFFMCKVDRAFTNCSIQISCVLPNLREISIDFCNDFVALPIGLCEIVNLEKLSITNCHELSSLPEELGKLINLKTLRLRSCIHLEKLPESISMLHELVDLDISHCVGLTKLPDKIGNLQKLEKLNMWSCPIIRKLPASLRNLKNLRSVVCEEEIAKWLDIVSPRLRNLVTEHKEEVNLDWLLA